MHNSTFWYADNFSGTLYKSLTRPGGETNTYAYDNNNNQLTMVDSTGTTTRVYDELGRVTSKTVPTVGTTTFLYDQATGLTSGYVNESYIDPKGNTVVRTKDKAGRLYQVKDGTSTTTYQYYANGNLRKLEYPNGATEEYTYYANNKLHTLLNKQGIDTLEAFSYEYDGAGNMTGKADRKGTTNYTYDDLNRLLSTEEPTGKLTAYEFDAAGNRTSETVTEGSNATRTEYTYNEQNRLTSTNKLVNSQESGGEEYSFDNNGNVLSVLPYTVTVSAITTSALTVNLSVLGNEDTTNTTGAKIYEYDARNQMVKAIEGAYTVESEYNGDGLRVSKTVNGETSNYLYEYDKIILETDGSGTEIAQNTYGTNLISRSVGSDTLYYMYNGHGDVTALQTADGITATQYYYDAFGTPTEETAAVNNPFRYAGYEFGAETDLYYLKARFYNSVTARFMQEDTYRGKANDPLSLNLYIYCNNNPLIYWDYTGHWAVGDGKRSPAKQAALASLTVKWNNTKNPKEKDAIHDLAQGIRDGSVSSYQIVGNKYTKSRATSDVSSIMNSSSVSKAVKQDVSSSMTLGIFTKKTNDTKAINKSISNINDYLKFAEKDFWSSNLFTGDWWQDPTKLGVATAAIQNEINLNGDIKTYELNYSNKINAIQRLINVNRTGQWDMKSLNSVETIQMLHDIDSNPTVIDKGTFNAILDYYPTVIGQKSGDFLERYGLSDVPNALAYGVIGIGLQGGNVSRSLADEVDAQIAAGNRAYQGTGSTLIKGFNQAESTVINEANLIMKSPEFAQIKVAQQSGQSVTVKINGRIIQYEPGAPCSGMTMFGENGFIIGREAFASEVELNKTVLHELYRLNTSASAGGVSGELAAQETSAAANFVDRAIGEVMR